MQTIPATVLATARPPFLLLSVASVLLGVASSAWTGDPIDALATALALLGALSAHAAVNLHNEWHDFRSGLDATTRRTPFSGGSGALPAHPAAARATFAASVAAAGVTALAGLWLVDLRGPALLPIGALGLSLVFGYTGWITRRPLACLLAPGLGIGPLMVVGTAIAAGGAAHASTWLVSLVPGALASGLLLLNQFPDVDPDRAAGRKHLPIAWGRARAARVFAALVAAPFACVTAGVAAGALPAESVVAMLAAPLAVAVARGALRDAEDSEALLPTMARNVTLSLGTPVLLAAGLWWAAA